MVPQAELQRWKQRGIQSRARRMPVYAWLRRRSLLVRVVSTGNAYPVPCPPTISRMVAIWSHQDLPVTYGLFRPAATSASGVKVVVIVAHGGVHALGTWKT